MMLEAIIRPFRRPTPAEKAARDLADAELFLLAALNDRESADAYITVYKQRIARLRTYLANLEGGAS